jgi:hypothetical protein
MEGNVQTEGFYIKDKGIGKRDIGCPKNDRNINYS